ncbi:MAG: hypothetical protein RL748_4147 [Pseudomonadota bacterium]|jgi:hypothetical protein
MFAKTKNYYRVLINVCAFILMGCGTNNDEPKSGAKMNAESIPLIQRESGYFGGELQWRELLSCWHASHLLRYKKVLIEYPTMPYLPIVTKDAAALQKSVADKRIHSEIADTEKRLGLILPKSYKDFILAYQPTELKQSQVGQAGSYVGMYALTQIGKFGQLMPELTQDLEKFPIDADDIYYRHYGVGQDDAHIRTKYIRDLIVVGKYGTSNFELIFLYPQIKTKDGEMQAGLRFHSGEYRAPSFAELMRQLSVLETVDVGHVPPYPQKMLKGLCAEKLPLMNVWWE